MSRPVITGSCDKVNSRNRVYDELVVTAPAQESDTPTPPLIEDVPPAAFTEESLAVHQRAPAKLRPPFESDVLGSVRIRPYSHAGFCSRFFCHSQEASLSTPD
jgi:hypothetical protein